MTTRIRAQKYIAELGVCSRHQAEIWIAEARVTVNGETLQLGEKVDPDNDLIRLDGKPLIKKKAPLVYWLLHKPDGFLTSRHQDGGKPTIYDLPSLRGKKLLVNPVGRLDYRTEGLLILTNDGDLSHKLCHPTHKVPRKYYIVASKRLKPEQEVELRRKGIELEDGYVKCHLRYHSRIKLGASFGASYSVTIRVGRKRIVRRIFEHFGVKVVRLVRTDFGPLALPADLAPGDMRQITREQLKSLKETQPKRA